MDRDMYIDDFVFGIVVLAGIYFAIRLLFEKDDPTENHAKKFDEDSRHMEVIHKRTSNYSNSSEYWKSKSWEKLKYELFKENEGKCEFCGNDAVTGHHHTYPSRFEDDTIDNLISVCQRCHAVIHRKIKGPPITTPNHLNIDLDCYYDHDYLNDFKLFLANSRPYYLKRNATESEPIEPYEIDQKIFGSANENFPLFIGCGATFIGSIIEFYKVNPFVPLTFFELESMRCALTVNHIQDDQLSEMKLKIKNLGMYFFNLLEWECHPEFLSPYGFLERIYSQNEMRQNVSLSSDDELLIKKTHSYFTGRFLPKIVPNEGVDNWTKEEYIKIIIETLKNPFDQRTGLFDCLDIHDEQFKSKMLELAKFY